MFGVWVRRLLSQRGGIGTASTCEAGRPTRVAPRPNLTFSVVAPSGSRECHGCDGRSCHHFCSDAAACAPCTPIMPKTIAATSRATCLLWASSRVIGGLPSTSTRWSQPSTARTVSPPRRPRTLIHRCDDCTAFLASCFSRAARRHEADRRWRPQPPRRPQRDETPIVASDTMPKLRAATPAVPLDRVCSADQPASFDAIVFPPATNGSDGPGTVIPRSRGGPTVVMWRSFRGNLAVPSRASQPQRDEACSLAQRELRNPGAGMRYAIRAASRDATTWCPRESG